MSDFQPLNRFGNLPADDQQPSNVYWNDEFPSIDRASLKGAWTNPIAGPRAALDIETLDGISVGDSVQSSVQFVIGNFTAITGTVRGFIPQPRTELTVHFLAEIRLSDSVSVDVSPARTLYLPLDQLQVLPADR